MISTARSSRSESGFSLLEIVIALSIAAMVLGGAIAVMKISSDEHALKKASGELELIAKRARAAAILQQRPYAIEFSQGLVRMMPLSQIELDDMLIEENGDAAAEGWELTLDNGMEAQVRRWNSDTWVSFGKNTTEVWRFDPNGLCEPISVQLKLNESSAYLEFNLLTAAIREKEYDIR